MRGINTFTLKMIGLLSMLTDHIGMIFYPDIIWFRVIGRLAFPIFAYAVVEGFCHTKDIRRYMLRIAFFALLSEVPFDLAVSGRPVDFSTQNVMFTLLLGLLMLYFTLKAKHVLSAFFIVIGMFLLAELCRTDYSSMGLAMIFVFYRLRDEKIQKAVGISAINIILMGGIQAYASLAMVPISFHSGKQGMRAKWLFGLFYPAHLLILYLIAQWI